MMARQTNGQTNGRAKRKAAARRTGIVPRWVGRMLAVFLMMMTASGVALAWPDAIDRIVHPARFATTGAAVLPPDAYVVAAQARLGEGRLGEGRLGEGRHVASLTLPAGRGPVVIVAVPGPSTVYLDPPTARVLGVATDGDGAWLRRVHRELLLPGVGRFVVGAIGVAAMLWAVIGVWRRVRAPRARSRERHAGDPEPLRSQERNDAGRWTTVPAGMLLLPLGVMTATGTWLAFAAPRERLSDSVPLVRPGQPVAAIMARARGVAPGAVRRVEWPARHRPDWTVTLSGGAVVKVADDTGAAGAAVVRGTGRGAGLVRRLHDGTGMGPFWRIAMVLGGVVAVVWVAIRTMTTASKSSPARGGGRSTT